MIDEEKYMTYRIENQINWYSSKSSSNKKYYYIFKTLEIILAAVVPFLIALSDSKGALKLIAGILSIIVSIAASILLTFKFQEKWIQYRATLEALKHEKNLYETNSGIYAANPEFNTFVERIEFIISKENSDWTQIAISKEIKKQ